MEHVDRFRKLGDVADAMFNRSVNSDLTDPLPNTRHWFPVRRLHSLLSPSKLKAREPSGIRRECLKVITRWPKPQNRLFCRDVNMQVLVYFCQETTFSQKIHCAHRATTVRLPSPLRAG